MLQTLWTAPLLSLILSALVPDEAATLLDRAIKAQGGDEKLSKAQGATFTAKGTLELGDIKAELSGDFAVQAVDHTHWNVTLNAMGQSQSGMIVINPTKIWAKVANQEAKEAPAAEQAFLRDAFRALRLPQNLAALRSPDVVLS